MMFFAIIGWAFTGGCALAVFILPVYFIDWVFTKDNKGKTP